MQQKIYPLREKTTKNRPKPKIVKNCITGVHI